MGMKVFCAVCARQIVNYDVDDQYMVGSTSEPVKTGFGNQAFCHICSRDLDSNGNFPEETE